MEWKLLRGRCSGRQRAMGRSTTKKMSEEVMFYVLTCDRRGLGAIRGILWLNHVVGA